MILSQLENTLDSNSYIDNHNILFQNRIIDFSYLIAFSTVDFIGRQQLIEQIKSLPDNIKRICILGSIGSGKTAFISYMASRSENVVGCYFFKYDEPNSFEIKNFVITVAFQISTQLKYYKKEIFNDDNLNRMDYFELFKLLISKPLSETINLKNTYYIIIDGIDELKRSQNYNSFIEFINSDIVKNISQYIKIIFTCRKGEKHYIDVDETIILDETNENDIKQFLIENKFHPHEIDIVLQKIDNNFLYASLLVKDQKSKDNLTLLPSNLENYYSKIFSENFINKKKNSFDKKIKKFLEVLVLTSSKVEEFVLKDITGFDEYEYKKILDRTSIIIKQENGFISLFHKSIYDWLLSFEKSQKYFISIKDATKKIFKFIETNKIEKYASFYKNLYKSLYYYGLRDESFNILKILIDNELNDYDDMINYISLAKGIGKWKEAVSFIYKVESYELNHIQKCYLFYYIGRVYIDDINNINNSIGYLTNSIKCFNKNKPEYYIVLNSIIMFYFYKGEFEKVKSILQEFPKKRIFMNTTIEYTVQLNRYTLLGLFEKGDKSNIIKNMELLKKSISGEIKVYLLNNLALLYHIQGKDKKTKELFESAKLICHENSFNYAAAAVYYNIGLLEGRKDFIGKAKKIVYSHDFSIGNYIVNNPYEQKHILNTYKVNKKNYWICLKNVDLFL